MTAKLLLASLPDGCQSKLPTGKWICLFYNKGICKNQKKGQCANGLHQCYYKGCNKKVPYIECSHIHNDIQPQQSGQCETSNSKKRPIDTDENTSSKRPVTVSQTSLTDNASSSKTDDTNSDRKLIFIEFCAGSASLSSAMMKAGFHPMPVDFAGSKFTPKVKAISYRH